MRISKKLIAQTCLPIYKQLLRKGKKDSTERFYTRLLNKHAAQGICLLYNCTPNAIKNIYSYLPLQRLCKKDRYGKYSFSCTWYCKIPASCNSKKEMVECIQKRIDLLEKWL